MSNPKRKRIIEEKVERDLSPKKEKEEKEEEEEPSVDGGSLSLDVSSQTKKTKTTPPPPPPPPPSAVGLQVPTQRLLPPPPLCPCLKLYPWKQPRFLLLDHSLLDIDWSRQLRSITSSLNSTTPTTTTTTTTRRKKLFRDSSSSSSSSSPPDSCVVNRPLLDAMFEMYKADRRTINRTHSVLHAALCSSSSSSAISESNVKKVFDELASSQVISGSVLVVATVLLLLKTPSSSSSSWNTHTHTYTQREMFFTMEILSHVLTRNRL